MLPLVCEIESGTVHIFSDRVNGLHRGDGYGHSNIRRYPPAHG